jgi:transposase
MNNEKLCCGIDVSQNTLDVAYQNNLGEIFHIKVGNNNKGFETILEHTGTCYHFAMEATSVYYVRLAFFLHAKGCALSVVNALTIKRYIQMHLERNKSDKKDALWICRYAIDQKPALWEMPDTAYFESKQLYNTVRQYSEQIKRFNNQLHNLRLLPVQNKETIKSLAKMKGYFEKEIQLLEEKLEALLMKWKPEQMKSVGSIKAIGRRATAMLIIYTQGFRYTQNHRQLISFAGLSPREYSSGSSINGKPKICRKGGKPIRDVLYMCAMSAIKTNTACKALYERLRSKGKSGKLALIAVCNKLLKQVLAVVKNNSLYQPNYCSTKP